MREVFIHLHIPKCGGTTVADFLSRNFGQKLLLTNGVLNDYQYDAYQVEKIINHFPSANCISGHKLSLDLPFYRDDLNLHAFTWVRDPIDRFVSHYFFHRSHTTLVPEAKTMNLLDYTKWALQDGNQPMYINGQSRFLCGGKTDMNKIESRISDMRLSLFPLNDLQESFYTLATQFPKTFRDVTINSKNISKKDQQLPEGFHDLIMPFVSDDLHLLNLSKKTVLQNNAPKTGYDSSQLFFKFIVRSMAKYLKGGAKLLEKSV